MGRDFSALADRDPPGSHPDAVLPEVPRARAYLRRREGVARTDASAFRQRYGPWALITGGSEGLGAEFARQLAERGLNLVLGARRADVLARFASELQRRFSVEVRTVPRDLAERGSVEALCSRAADLTVGLLVVSAALSPLGEFLDLSAADHDRLLDLNCRVPSLLCREMGRRMAERRRGGIVLLSSVAGFQGTGFVAHYAASKAYVRVLAEGLWSELRGRGVDVLASCPGIVRTPTLEEGRPAHPAWLASPVMECEPVVRQTLRALGRRPVVIPGAANRVSAWITQRLLPRRAAVALASAGTRAMYPGRFRGKGSRPSC